MNEELELAKLRLESKDAALNRAIRRVKNLEDALAAAKSHLCGYVRNDLMWERLKNGLDRIEHGE